MTEPDFRGRADKNPQLFGVNLDYKPTLGADLSSETGRGRKSGGAYAPSAPPRWAPLSMYVLIYRETNLLIFYFWPEKLIYLWGINGNSIFIFYEIFHFLFFRVENNIFWIWREILKKDQRAMGQLVTVLHSSIDLNRNWTKTKKRLSNIWKVNMENWPTGSIIWNGKLVIKFLGWAITSRKILLR